MGKVGKNALNDERMWDELLYYGLKPFKFWALILETGESNLYTKDYTIGYNLKSSYKESYLIRLPNRLNAM